MVTYDQIVLDVMARQDLSPADRREVLEFIRDFKVEISSEIIDKIPEPMRSKLVINLT